MFRLFSKKKNFVFDINIDTKPFVNDLSPGQLNIVKKFHKRQKKTIEFYAREIAVKCKRDFKSNPAKTRTSCLELCVLYHYFFGNEFEKIKADAAVSRLFFATIYHNFSDLNSKLLDLEYEGLSDFIHVKEKYYKEVHDMGSRLELSHYYYHTYARYPLMRPENYKTLPPYFDYVDSFFSYMFFLDITARIRTEAEEMSKALAVAGTVHSYSHAHA